MVLLSHTRSASREDLIEAAKKDREVVFYTTTNLEEAGAMSRHFKAKYPFLEININRAEGERIVTKVLQETRAQKSLVDVIQTPAFYLYAFERREAFLGEYAPADDRFYPRNFKRREILDYYLLQSLRRSLQHQAHRRSKSSKSVMKICYHPFWKNKMILEKDKIDWFTAMFAHYGPGKGN